MICPTSLIGSATAVLGMFPPEYIGTMGSGAGIGGLIPSLINVAILGLSKDSSTVVGIACFCIATLIALSCFVLTYSLQRNAFYRFYGGSFSQQHRKNSDEVMYILTVLFHKYVKFNIKIAKGILNS